MWKRARSVRGKIRVEVDASASQPQRPFWTYPHYNPNSSVLYMPSPAAFGVSLPQPCSRPSRRRLSRYLEGDTVVPGDEHQCILFIKNVDQRRLDASGEALRHLLTVHGGREAVAPRSGGTRWDRRWRERVAPSLVMCSVTGAVHVCEATGGSCPRVSSSATSRRSPAVRLGLGCRPQVLP